MGITRKRFLYFGIILLLLGFCFQYSQILNYPDYLCNISRILGLISLTICFMLKRELKVFIKVLLIIPLIIIYYYSRQTAIFEFALVLMAIEKNEIVSIIKLCLRFLLIVLSFHIIIYTFEYLINPENLSTIVRSETNTVRHSFLFSHSNLFGMLCTWTYLMFLFLNKDNLKVKHYVIGFLISLFLFFICDSRTSAYVCFITIFLLFFYKNININVKRVLKHSFTILGLLSYMLVVLYPHVDFVKKIDEPEFFHGRIKLGYIAYNYNLISPFGDDISYFDNINLYNDYKINNYTIDSTYYKYLFIYGYLFTVFIFVFYEYKVKNLSNNDNVICFITAYSLSAFMESFAIYPIIYFPIMIIYTLNKTIKENNYEEKRKI